MMHCRILVAALLVASQAAPAAAQRGRRSTPDRNDRDTGRVVSTSETRFTPNLRSGQRLSLGNIDGNVTVTQGSGASAEITARKIVRQGDGELVKAVLEETSNGVRICTVYLQERGDDTGCSGDHRQHSRRQEPLDVDMEYVVRLPAGVSLTVNTVDGNIEARGIDTPAELRSVDGNITFDGVAPESLNSVDGSITATITDRDWSHSLSVRTVDGEISLTLPASLNARISGQTVDGEIESDFPVTVQGRWGPQTMHGDIGNGRGPSLELSSVDGAIHLLSSDGTRRGSSNDSARRRRP